MRRMLRESAGRFGTAWRVALRLMFAIVLACGVYGIAAAQSENGVQVRSGGIGSEERAELLAQSDQYNLRLAFATAGGAYVADVHVKLYEERGGAYHQVYDGKAEGPWFFARVAPGQYRVEASYRDVTQTRELKVGARQKPAQIIVRWSIGDKNG
jgi:hypothetical protein